MKKIPNPYLEDILESISRIEEYIADINQKKEAFEDSIEKQDSVIRRIELIGEATKRLEEDFKNQYSEIPWRKMAGMRDVLIHEYDQVDPNVSTLEVQSGGTPNAFDKDYKLSEKIIFSGSDTDYITSYPGMMNLFKIGEAKQIDRISEDSVMQRHTIGIVHEGDLEGKMVFTDYRFIATEEDVFIDGLMIYGSKEKMESFLEKVAKTKAPKAEHSTPAFSKDGKALY